MCQTFYQKIRGLADQVQSLHASCCFLRGETLVHFVSLTEVKNHSLNCGGLHIHVASHPRRSSNAPAHVVSSCYRNQIYMYSCKHAPSPTLTSYLAHPICYNGHRHFTQNSDMVLAKMTGDFNTDVKTNLCPL